MMSPNYLHLAPIGHVATNLTAWNSTTWFLQNLISNAKLTLRFFIENF